jgi:hypothetical protein
MAHTAYSPLKTNYISYGKSSELTQTVKVVLRIVKVLQ